MCCHELRIVDQEVTWRIVYRVDPDAIVIAEVFAKKTADPGSGVGAVSETVEGIR